MVIGGKSIVVVAPVEQNRTNPTLLNKKMRGCRSQSIQVRYSEMISGVFKD